MMKKIKYIVILTLALILLFPGVFGQSITNNIKDEKQIQNQSDTIIVCGYVRDEYRAPIPYATVDPYEVLCYWTCDENGYYEEEYDAKSSEPFVVSKDGRYRTIERWVELDTSEIIWENYTLPFNRNSPENLMINGLENTNPGEILTYTAEAYDDDDDELYYNIYWSDKDEYEQIGPVNSGEEITFSRIFYDVGEYELKIIVYDDIWSWRNYWVGPDEYNSFEKTEKIIIESEAPSIPVISGPNSGKAGTEYTYEFTSTEPDGDKFYYYIKWGDGVVSASWQYNSGETASVKHIWAEEGDYTIEAQSIDEYGAESDWNTYTIKISKTRSVNNPVIYQLKQFFENWDFPILTRLLNL